MTDFVRDIFVPLITDKLYNSPGEGFGGRPSTRNPSPTLPPVLSSHKDNDRQVVHINGKNFSRGERRGVFKFKYAGIVYYRLGYGCQDALLQLRRELGTISGSIETMDEGKVQ